MRMVPFGDFHILLKPNSSTRCSSGVMVAHFTPTRIHNGSRAIDGDLVFRPVPIDDAKVVILQFNVEIRQDKLFLDEFRIIRVISSPSSSTTGVATLILLMQGSPS